MLQNLHLIFQIGVRGDRDIVQSDLDRMHHRLPPWNEDHASKTIYCENIKIDECMA
jgi:hypothetical protein